VFLPEPGAYAALGVYHAARVFGQAAKQRLEHSQQNDAAELEIGLHALSRLNKDLTYIGGGDLSEKTIQDS